MVNLRLRWVYASESGYLVNDRFHFLCWLLNLVLIIHLIKPNSCPLLLNLEELHQLILFPFPLKL